MPSAAGLLELRDRAYNLLADGAVVDDAALLAHVYGGVPPDSLHARLLEPFLADPRLERSSEGKWARRVATTPAKAAVTALALVATGPSAERARLVRLTAVHLENYIGVGRFDVTVHPGRHVPRYVAERAGLAREVLNDLPAFDETVLDDLLGFLGDRPIVAQEARQTWQFIVAEARRLGRTLLEPTLIDVNHLAANVFDLAGKPNLAVVAQRLGIGFTRIDQPDEEARVLGLVLGRLLEATPAGASGPQPTGAKNLVELARAPHQAPGRALRRGATARDLPDAPGVYVLRDEQQSALYVGKARRLRSRMAAYVHRPLGATRRLEGLSDAVQAVEAQECATDLEALVLEDREIRRLQPRFNTQRRLHAPRTWLRLPEQEAPRTKSRARARLRLELARGPEAGPGEYLGPFRNERAAVHARDMARAAFRLDEARRCADPEDYVELLRQAWAFVRGESDVALEAARAQHARAIQHADDRAIRRTEALLRSVRDYAPAHMVLPADPREARYAVVRKGLVGVELLLLDRAILMGSWVVEDGSEVATLLANSAPRTEASDVDVVLHWLGAQRSTARLVHLPDEATAADRIDDAILEVQQPWS